MSAKHTPGPWSLAESKVFMYQTLIMANGNSAPIATLYGSLTDCENGRNARLIAAAPDLLEALHAIVSSLSDNDEEGLIEHSEQIIAARAAIAKATGGVQ